MGSTIKPAALVVATRVTLYDNSRKDLRASLDVLRGQMRLNLRVWFIDDESETRPGKQGVALRVGFLSELQAAHDRLARGKA